MNQVIVNSLVYLSVLISLYIGESLESNKAGFWCNDKSIRHEHLPTIVNFYGLLVVAIVVPVLAFTLDLTDFKYYFRNYTYALPMNIVLTVYCKLIVGRPRPNFHSLCKPVWSPDIQCNPDDEQFISEYTCSNPGRWYVINSIQSFYSGHASLGAFSSMYLIFYLYDKLKLNGFLKAHLFMIIFMLGLLPGLSQYVNFWHFPSDIIIGYIAGICMALFAYYGIQAIDRPSVVQKSVKASS